MPKYLCREGNTFLFRRRVPGHLQERIGRREIYRSLKTSVARLARQRAAALFLASEKLFAMADDYTVNDEDIRAAARRWLAQPHWQTVFDRQIDSKLPGELRWEGHELPSKLLELGTDYEHGFTPLWARRHQAEAALEDAGYPQQPISVLDRTAEVLADLIHQRVEKRMQEVFRPEATTAPGRSPVAQEATPTQSVATPKVSENLEEWHAALISGWPQVKAVDPHSAGQYLVSARLFTEILGDRHFGDITWEDGETFRDQLIRLPSSHGKGRHVPALEAIAKTSDAGISRMSMKTAKRHNTAMNRYWEWLLHKGLIPRSPSPFQNHKFPGTRSSSRDREAWTKEQLEQLLKSADYLGHPRDSAHHWLPLISLHSGMRLEEMCRLRPVDDVQTVNGVPCFVIQPHPDGWDPKTEAGERRIPVHRWLIDHGFLKLIEERRRAASGRVFPELPLQQGKLGAQFSRDFSRFKKAFGYGPKHVFHSFRHTFRTELEDTSHKDSHINAVMGHEGGNRGEGRTYVKGVSVKVLANVVESFTSPLELDFLNDADVSGRRPVRVRKVRLQPRVPA